MTVVLRRRGDAEAQRHRHRHTAGEGHVTVTVDAETGVLLPQAKEHPGPPATLGAKRKAWNRFSPRLFGGTMALLTS